MCKNSKFVFFIALAGFAALYSCNTPKTGFFQNRYENYQATKTPAPDVKPETYASNTPEVTPIIEKSLVEEKTPLNTGTKKFTSNEKLPEGSLKTGTRKLTKEEKKEIKKDIKETIKKAKQNDTEVNTVLLVILAVLLPPLAVALVDGITGPFWLSILLTLLFYLPGLIYALYRIFRQ